MSWLWGQVGLWRVEFGSRFPCFCGGYSEPLGLSPRVEAQEGSTERTRATARQKHGCTVGMVRKPRKRGKKTVSFPFFSLETATNHVDRATMSFFGFGATASSLQKEHGDTVDTVRKLQGGKRKENLFLEDSVFPGWGYRTMPTVRPCSPWVRGFGFYRAPVSWNE
jgi:hypothetical protein